MVYFFLMLAQETNTIREAQQLAFIHRKKSKQLKTFSTKIRPTVSLMEVPLAKSSGLTGGVKIHSFGVSKIVLPKS